MIIQRTVIMSGFSSILKEIDVAVGLDQCTICADPTYTKDVLGFPWCAEHEHRGHVLSWGFQHRFPALPIEGLPMEKYAIAATERSWWMAVTLGNDDFVWIVAIYTDYLNSLEWEKKAS